MIRKALIISLIALGIGACKKGSENPPHNLLCDNQKTPISIDHNMPAFSWQMNSDKKAVLQSAYQILVASNEKLLNDEQADVWNSGIVKSDKSAYIACEGKELKSNTRYYWTVKTWDTSGFESGYAGATWFETGLMNKSDWKARWITAPDDLKSNSSVLMRKTISVDKKVARAKLYVTALGGYVLYLNGKKVGNNVLAPGWTNYKKTIQYQAYDVTKDLKDGKNAFGVYLGNLWYRSFGDSKTLNSRKLKLLLQLEIEYKSGEKVTLISDENWKAGISPILQNNIYKGEQYDGRKELEGWLLPKFNDDEWPNAVKATEPEAKLVAEMEEPIQIIDEIRPSKFVRNGSNVITYDFGKNLTGWLKVKVKCQAGTSVVIKYKNKQDETNVQQVDEFICHGDGIEEWQPKFTCHTFRFIEITGAENPDAVACIIRNNVARRGEFNCSNPMINKIYSAIIQSQENNMTGTMQSCGNFRKCKGGTGSVQLFNTTACFNFDMARMNYKYMRDLSDCQFANGTVPVSLFSEKPEKAAPGWSEAMALVPWETYVYYGDKRILSDYYENITHWHKSQEKESDQTSPPCMHPSPGPGDKYALEKTPEGPIGSAYYYIGSLVVSKIANALGNQEDNDYYLDLSNYTKDQFNQSHMKYRTARYWAETQTAHALPLALGMCPIPYQKRVASYIAGHIRKHDMHPTTGIMGTKFLLPMLSSFGFHNEAIELISQNTYPSWGYMVENGNGTLWESWNKSDSLSDNSILLASVGEWMYAYVAGIRPDPKFPGYKHSFIVPGPGENLDWAEGSINTSYGKLAVRWDKKDTRLIVKINIPANTSSTLNLPVNDTKKAKIYLDGKLVISEGKKTADMPAIIKFKGYDAKMAVIAVGSGSYEFKIED